MEKKICPIHAEKRKYRTRKIAWDAVAYYFKTLSSEGNIYKCKGCGYYHITTHSPMPPEKKNLLT